MTVRTYDSETGFATTRLLDMCLTSGTSSGTAANIFNAMDTALVSRAILWSHCVCVSVDNTSVNMGRHNSIRTWATLKHPNVYMMGCPCHIIHSIVQKASETFEEVHEC